MIDIVAKMAQGNTRQSEWEGNRRRISFKINVWVLFLYAILDESPFHQSVLNFHNGVATQH